MLISGVMIGMHQYADILDSCEINDITASSHFKRIVSDIELMLFDFLMNGINDHV